VYKGRAIIWVWVKMWVWDRVLLRGSWIWVNCGCVGLLWKSGWFYLVVGRFAEGKMGLGFLLGVFGCVENCVESVEYFGGS
jgi:hypothetical protein